jgi:hypothetical protein
MLQESFEEDKVEKSSPKKRKGKNKKKGKKNKKQKVCLCWLLSFTVSIFELQLLIVEIAFSSR